MIAASALRHGAIVVTGNVSDFAPTRVAVENPF
jgi:predicted nucleic acid-binding protein